MKLWMAYAALGIALAFLLALALAGCQPDGGCRSTVTGSDITLTQACGGSGDHAAGTVQTPAPVVVPPVAPVIVVPPVEGGGA